MTSPSTMADTRGSSTAKGGVRQLCGLRFDDGRTRTRTRRNLKFVSYGGLIVYEKENYSRSGKSLVGVFQHCVDIFLVLNGAVFD